MKIGELAARTDLSIDTLRYYEKLGLITPPRRIGGQRVYDETAPGWIAFLKALKATGMSLHDMKRYALMRARGAETAAPRRTMLERQRAIVRDRIAELQDCLAMLDHKIDNYHAIEAEHARTDARRANR